MPHWTTRTFGQCAYLLTASDACCASVVGGSAMGSRYCGNHYEAMIDRPAMARAAKRSGGHATAGLRTQTETMAVHFTRHDRQDKYNALKPRAPKIETVWDSGRA